MSRTDDIKRKLVETARRQRDLLDNFSRVLTSGETQPGEQEQLQARLQRLMAEHQRLNDELKIAELESREIPGTPRLRALGRPLREQTLETLEHMGAPIAPTPLPK